MTRCYYCNQGYCSTHEKVDGIPGKMYRTGIQYSKPFRVLNPKTGEITQIFMRSDKERKKAAQIEVDDKIATCSLCQTFTRVTNYYVTTTQGSSNANICSICKETNFSTTRQKLHYILKKLKQRLGEWVEDDPNYSKLFNV